MSGHPVILVHSLAHLRAASAAAEDLGRPVTLRSAPGAAAYAGIGYLRALAAEARKSGAGELVIDCGGDAGLVMAALRTGCRMVAFSGPPEIGERLAAIAAGYGAALSLEDGPPSDALDLLDAPDPEELCRSWLKAYPAGDEGSVPGK